MAFVPNLHDLPKMEGWENVISPLDRWSTVIRRISQAGLVISSSLHGLVVADAFGIPCTYLRLSEEENILKYEDYVLGVGRKRLDVARSRQEAVRADPMEPGAPGSGEAEGELSLRSLGPLRSRRTARPQPPFSPGQAQQEIGYLVAYPVPAEPGKVRMTLGQLPDRD